MEPEDRVAYHLISLVFGFFRTQRVRRLLNVNRIFWQDPNSYRFYPGPEHHDPGPGHHDPGPEHLDPGPEHLDPGPEHHDPGPEHFDPGR